MPNRVVIKLQLKLLRLSKKGLTLKIGFPIPVILNNGQELVVIAPPHR